MPMIDYKRLGQRGFGLVEILVTVGITTVGLVGLVALLLESDRAAMDSRGRALAVLMVDDMTNRILANPDGIASYHTSGSPVDCNQTVTRCARAHNGASIDNANVCSADNMARFDLWDVACPSGVDDNDADFTYSGNADFLPNPRLTVTVTQNQGAWNTSNEVNIALTWDVRTQGTDASGNEIYTNSDDIQTRTATVESEFSLR